VSIAIWKWRPLWPLRSQARVMDRLGRDEAPLALAWCDPEVAPAGHEPPRGGGRANTRCACRGRRFELRTESAPAAVNGDCRESNK